MRSSSSTALPLLGLLAATAVGCGELSSTGTMHARFEDLPSGGVRVTNDGVGEWRPGEAWTVVEDLRLGSVMVEGPELFGQIQYVVADSAGRIFVLDYQAQDIRVFQPTGEFSHRFGGEGQGPGELTSAAGLSWSGDGSLWVYGTRDYNVFRPDGTFLERYARRIGAIYRPWSGGFVGNAFVDWGGERERAGTDADGRPLFSGRTIYHPIRFTPPERLDTLPPVIYQAPITEDGELMYVPGPVTSAKLRLTRDGHLWIAQPHTYELYKRTLEGDTLVEVRMEGIQPASFNVDSIVAASEERGGAIDRARMLTELEVATRILTDGQGHVYVWPQEADAPVGSVVDVFEDTGIYLGRMTFPEPIRITDPPPQVTGDHIYAGVQGEDGIPYVVRYRIVRP